METIEIKIGDVVRLKSGSLQMTVEDVYTRDGITYATCVFFNREEILVRNVFVVENLSKVDNIPQ